MFGLLTNIISNNSFEDIESNLFVVVLKFLGFPTKVFHMHILDFGFHYKQLYTISNGFFSRRGENCSSACVIQPV